MRKPSRRVQTIGVTLTLALTLLLPTAAAADPPPNDSFNSATQVASLPFEETLDTSGAATEAVDNGVCASARTVWYALTLTAGQVIAVDTRGTAFSTDIAVYTTPVPVTTSCSSTRWRTIAAGTNGGNYLVRIGTRDPDPQGPLHVAIYAPGSITGKVVDAQGAPLRYIDINIYEVGKPYPFDWGYTNVDGTYSFTNLPQGRYQLEFIDYRGVYVPSWYLDAADRAGALTLEVTNGPVAVQQKVMSIGGSIEGVVRFPDGTASPTCIEAYRADGSWLWWADGPFEDGSFMVTGLPTGEYKLVVFEGCWQGPYGFFDEEWYQDAPDFATATPISVTQGQATTGIEIVLDPTPPPANDDFANATTLEALPVSLRQGLARATSEPSDPAVCGISGRSVWYSYTPTEDELLNVNVYGTNSSAAIHTVGEDGSLSLFGCPRVNGWTSSEFRLDQGTTYMIQIGAVDTEELAGAYVSLFDSDGGGTLHFAPSQPCALLCPYWNQQRTDVQKNEDACAPEPASPEGSWEDHRIDVPASVNNKVPYALGFAMNPKVDHDVWFCRVEPDEDGNYLVTYSANTTTKTCETGVPIVGCSERFQAPVEPGESYIIRVYNWSDTEPVDGSWWYLASASAGASAVQSN